MTIRTITNRAAATIEVGRNGKLIASAEPVRRGGGSAMVVRR